jgi:predicted MPP superfamily phosphohydrolase
MSGGWRVFVFVAIVLSIWTLMHVYVAGRVWGLPWLGTPVARRLLVAAMAVLWVGYPLARLLDRAHLGFVAKVFEALGANWMGVIFLLFASILAADLVTGFGTLSPSLSVTARSAGLAVGLLLSVVALAQGLRDPVVRSYDVEAPGLPAGLDGTTLVAVSDLHIGTLIGEGWTRRLVTRVDALQPDLICVVGDVIEGGSRDADALVADLRALRAPLGVWAVTGNHEYYAGLDTSLARYAQAGFTTLRDRWEEAAPGLVVAGVDDLTARQQYGDTDHFVAKALSGRPPGFTLLLSHTPWEADDASRLGVGLMLSGHTHDGQIWPFNYLVQLRYPYMGGRYSVGAMSLIVGRATGTWGPRMRLWRPSEILRITFHAE